MHAMKSLYCTLCWQEFDHPDEHNAPSAFNRERLNGYCRGDIRAKEHNWKPRVQREAGPLLNLDAADPIKIR